MDWRLLTRAEGMVYFSASSFGAEAAVASGRMKNSIALAPSNRIRRQHKLIELLGALFFIPGIMGGLSNSYIERMIIRVRWCLKGLAQARAR